MMMSSTFINIYSMGIDRNIILIIENKSLLKCNCFSVTDTAHFVHCRAV